MFKTKKRVIKLFCGALATPYYFPQYKYGLFQAILRWNFEWNFYRSLNTEGRPAPAKRFRILKAAIRYTVKQPEAEVCWTSAEPVPVTDVNESLPPMSED